MRVLVFGASGIVGRAFVSEAAGRRWPVRGLARAEADIADRSAVRAALAAHAPELVVNCAAFTRVDDCEREGETAARVNDLAVGILAEESERAGARLAHLSSDYVFDGTAREPYDETAPPAPLSAYGRTKRAGERRALAAPGALVVRTSAVFGPGGANFVDAIAGLLRRGGAPLRVVSDQVTAPTYAPFLARALADLGESRATGIWHYRNREPASWYELALAIGRELGPEPEIEAIPTAELPRPARRPAWSVLAVDKFETAFGRRVETWAAGLTTHLAAIAEEKR